MKAFLIRGQGVGVMHDRVFLRPPTDDEMRAALEYELQRHGVTFEKDEDGKAVAKARKRWVQTQEAELVGGPKDAGDDEPFECVRVTGSFDEEKLNAFLAESAKAPPGSTKAATPMMVVEGTGRVVNPGEKAAAVHEE